MLTWTQHSKKDRKFTHWILPSQILKQIQQCHRSLHATLESSYKTRSLRTKILDTRYNIPAQIKLEILYHAQENPNPYPQCQLQHRITPFLNQKRRQRYQKKQNIMVDQDREMYLRSEAHESQIWIQKDQGRNNSSHEEFVAAQSESKQRRCNWHPSKPGYTLVSWDWHP